MGFPPRKSRPYAVLPWVKSGSLYFFTLFVWARDQTNLLQPDTASILMKAATSYHEQQRWCRRLFLLMPDHRHALISFPSGGICRLRVEKLETRPNQKGGY